MEKQNMIQTNRRNIYKYGINQMFNMLLNIATFLAIGLFFHMEFETVIYTAAYIPLRIYAGGFHAKTPLKCWIISAIMLMSVLLVMKYAYWEIYIYDILVFISTITICFFSPVEDKNKPLDEIEKKVYKRKCILILAVELLIFILFRIFHINTVSICFDMVWVTLSIMLIAGKIKNGIIAKRNKEEKVETKQVGRKG